MLQRKKKQKLVCGISACAQTFSTASALREHMKAHLEKGYVCERCSELFITKTEYELHVTGLKHQQLIKSRRTVPSHRPGIFEKSK
jgi:hypothetical protein